jgi:hypothetical protein
MQRWVAALGTPAMVGAWVALGLAGLLLVWCWRRGLVGVWVPALWWLGGLAPAAFIVTTPWPGFDRWLYLAVPGLFLALQAALATRVSGRVQAMLAAAAIAVLAIITVQTMPSWRSNTTFYAAMIDAAPDDPYGYAGLGMEKARAGDWPASVYLLESAGRLGNTHPLAWEYLALGWAHTGECAKARGLFARIPEPLMAPRVSAALAACRPKASP